MKKLALLISTLVMIPGLLFAQSVTIKFATLAPEGSTWMNVMNEFDQALQEKTGGKVKFRIYAGGVQGDEKDVLRKIRINQLHSAGFTGVGLGEILPEVRILDAPFLFRDHDEVDYISRKFFDRFARKFEERGFILLDWVEVGFVYIYTNRQVQSIDDFKGVKMWMWEGDPLAEATFKAFGINPTPLSITEVLTSLQTGLIDGVYTAPMACVGLQWFTKLKYYVDVPLANSTGAVLISRRLFDRMNSEQQKILRDLSKEYLTELTRKSRIDNVTATKEMEKNGLKKISARDWSDAKDFAAIGRTARQSLVGKLYDQELLDDIEQALKIFRQKEESEQ